MKLCSAREMATRWGISIQLVRRYCKEGKIADAVLSEQGWMIPEGALKPGALVAREPVITPLVPATQAQHTSCLVLFFKEEVIASFHFKLTKTKK